MIAFLRKIRRFIPIFFLVFLIFIFFKMGGFHFFQIDHIRQIRGELASIALQHPIYMALVLMGIYMLYTISSMPGLICIELMIGWVFWQPLSLFIVVAAGTIGSTLVYLAVRFAFGKGLSKKTGSMFTKIREGFDRYQGNYLIFARTIPIFPTGLVNIACALLNVSVVKFVWTTAVGWVPAAFLHTNLGMELGKILESGENISWHVLVNWNVLPYLIAVGFLALAPIFLKKKKRQSDA